MFRKQNVISQFILIPMIPEAVCSSISQYYFDNLYCDLDIEILDLG